MNHIPDDQRLHTALEYERAKSVLPAMQIDAAKVDASMDIKEAYWEQYAKVKEFEKRNGIINNQI